MFVSEGSPRALCSSAGMLGVREREAQFGSCARTACTALHVRVTELHLQFINITRIRIRITCLFLINSGARFMYIGINAPVYRYLGHFYNFHKPGHCSTSVAHHSRAPHRNIPRNGRQTAVLACRDPNPRVWVPTRVVEELACHSRYVP